MKRRLLTLLAVLLAFSLLAAACGNSGDDDEAGDADVNGDDAGSDALDDETEPAVDDPDDETDEPDPEDETETDDPDDAAGPAVDRDTFVAIEGVPGVSDEEIAVAVVGIREFNPLGTCILDCYLTGIQAYFDYVNDAGGIFGRDLVIGEEFDDQLFLNQQAALDIISNEDSFASFQATLGASGWGDLDEAGIPTFTWNIHGAESAGAQSIFGERGTFCVDCTSRAVPYLASLAGATNVATLGYGDSESSRVCSQSLDTAFELYEPDLGITVGYHNESLAFGLAGGIGPEVSEMIEAGVDFIATCLDLNGMRTIAEELVRQNYREQVTMYHPNSYDDVFAAEAGNLFDGDYVIPSFAAFEYDSGTEMQSLYNQWVDAQGGQTAEQTMVGWLNADAMFQGILNAGPEFNRQSVIDTLNSSIYTGGGLINPIDWSRQHNPPTQDDSTNDYLLECISAVQMQDGGFIGFQEAPFMCWSNDTLDWSEPVPTNFGAG